MDEEPAAKDADHDNAAAESSSVFSNLPASRPGTRSPRRDGAKAVKAQARQEAPAKPKTGAKPKPPPKQARPMPPSEPEPEAQEQRSGGGLEDIAWAGVAAAAEAATLGVRLATKAFDTLRQNADRR